MTYWYLLWHKDFEADIARAEAEALLGDIRLEGRIAEAEALIETDRSAYLAFCLQPIACAPELESLAAKLQEPAINSPSFKIEVIKDRRMVKLGSREIATTLGVWISGKVDLTKPRDIFVALGLMSPTATGEPATSWWFGKVLNRSTRSWQEQKNKAFTFSASLDPRLARAMLNLVATTGEVVLDPCCGAGTIAIEAAQLGINCVSADLSRKMSWQAARNLTLFGANNLVCRGDARNFAGRFDAVVADLPAGRFSPIQEGFYRSAIENLAQLAPKAVYLAMEDISEILRSCGYKVQKLIKLRRGKLLRLVHLCHRLQPGAFTDVEKISARVV